MVEAPGYRFFLNMICKDSNTWEFLSKPDTTLFFKIARRKNVFKT